MSVSPLGYDLQFEQRPQYLLARVSGPEDSLEVSVAYWQQVAAEAIGRKAQRLMVVENFPNNGETADVMALGRFLAELGLQNIRIAFVDEQSDHLDRNRVGELVAVNRGLRGKVFADFAEGEQWLLAD
jgi:hypothetical protein